jgi:replicative DNA helicase
MLSHEDRVPPQALDIERTVLGSMMVDSAAAEIAFEKLTENAFYSGAHKRVFLCMKDMFTKNTPIDLVMLSQELQKNQWLDEVGGEQFIAGLTESIATSANMGHYAKILKEKETLRELINVSTQINTDCFNTDVDVHALVSSADSKIYDTCSALMLQKKQAVSSSSEVMSETLDELERMHAGGTVGVTMGFETLDKILLGLERESLIYLGGRPGQGKTSFAVAMMLKQAVVHGIPVGMFSLEMPKYQIGQRELAIETNVSLYSIRSGKISVEGQQKVAERSAVIANAPIYIDDTGGVNIEYIRLGLRRMIRKYGIQVCYVDHIHLMDFGNMDPTHGTTMISRGLKALAKECHIPIVALSQLHRLPKPNPKKKNRPTLSDLRQSGSLEQDADVVMLVHREFELTKKDEDKNDAEIIIAKQRNGSLGVINFGWEGKCSKFYEKEQQVEMGEF